MEKTKKRYSKSQIAVAVLLYGGLGIFALICVLPMWHVLMASVSDPLEFQSFEGLLFWPVKNSWSTEAYKLLFTNPYLWKSYLNTILYTFASVAIGLVIAIMASYALCRKDMVFKRPLLLIFMITLFFSGGMVPLYMVVHRLGMINTPWAVILPTCCNAMNIVMLRTGFLAIPDSIEEAAKIDGAGPVKIMVQIMVPLCVPFIVVVALFNGVAQWNSWANAGLYLQHGYKQFYPLSLVMRDVLMGAVGDNGIVFDNPLMADAYMPGVRMAAVIVSSLPLIIAYPFLQKHFEKGMIIGGIKG